VIESVGLPVGVKERAGERLTVLEKAIVPVSARQRLGVGDVDDVLDCTGLRVPVRLVFCEREPAPEDVPVLEEVIVLLPVAVGLGVREGGALRVPVEETVDVFD
jgi:hypothetical protein